MSSPTESKVADAGDASDQSSDSGDSMDKSRIIDTLLFMAKNDAALLERVVACAVKQSEDERSNLCWLARAACQDGYRIPGTRRVLYPNGW